MRSALFVLASAFVFAGVEAQTTTQPVTGILGNASVTTNNPVGVVYQATLPETEFFNPNDPNGNVKGSLSATASPDGKGVQITVNLSNFPKSGGPFLYHIHVAPVNSSGNCLSTLGHLDQYIRGETPACDPTLPQTCQQGDLAGKHGKITSDPFTVTYTDLYVSTEAGEGAFFGNRSLVVHYANTSRITCANFQLVSKGLSSPLVNSTGTSSGPSALFTGAASTVTVSGSVLAVFAAMLVACLL